METRHITTIAELRAIAEEVLSVCVKKDTANVITLSGDLGAGKTAFTKELAKLLKIEQEITSPTFVIMKTYKIQNVSPTPNEIFSQPPILNSVLGASEAYDQAVAKSTARGVNERSNNEMNQNRWLSFTHIDAYRIESDEEMRVLGFSQLLKDPSKLMCIEWPEKIQNVIPSDAYKIIFTLNNDGSRDVMFGT